MYRTLFAVCVLACGLSGSALGEDRAGFYGLLGGAEPERAIRVVELAEGRQILIFRPAIAGFNPFAPRPVDYETHKIGLHRAHLLEAPGSIAKPAPRLVQHEHDGIKHGHIVRWAGASN